MSFLEQALGRVRDCLRPGGKFIHIQDVRPSTHTVRDYEKYNLGRREVSVIKKYGKLWAILDCLPGFNSVGGIVRNGELIDVCQDFSERLVEAAESSGLEMVYSGKRFGHHLKKRDAVREYGEIMALVRNPEDMRVRGAVEVWGRMYSRPTIRRAIDKATKLDTLYFLGEPVNMETTTEPTGRMRELVAEFGNGDVEIMDPSFLRENGMSQQFSTVDVVVARKR